MALRIFDIKCLNPECEKVSEVFSEMNGDHRCGACGHEAKRVISPVAVAFKGRGFPGHEMKWQREHEKAGQRRDNS